MIDFYFRRPILYDYLVGFLTAILLSFLARRNLLPVPQFTTITSTISDLSTVALTLAGFVLTLLTVLISFKSSATTPNKQTSQKVFQKFFTSSLYFTTVNILKNAIVSLTLIALLGYLVKLSSSNIPHALPYCFVVLSIVVIFFTLWRCLSILSKIIKFQESD